MNDKYEQIHTMDKQVSILQHEVGEIKKLITNFTDKLESLFVTQTEILNSSVPEFEKTKVDVSNLNRRVGSIERRNELRDTEYARRAKLASWSLKNWKVLVSLLIFIGGIYEAGKGLYLAPSPKYNTHHKVKEVRND